MAGGIRVTDPSVYLAICAALVSSFDDLPISGKACFAAEIGLGGELRAVNRIEHRISEAEKLGFERIYVSAYSDDAIRKDRFKIELTRLKKVQELPKHLFG